MSKTTLYTGLELNENQARFLTLEHDSGKIKIQSCQQGTLRELAQYSLSSVAIGLPNGSTITNILETSLALQDDELESQIQLELPQLFPNADAKLYFDFTPFSTDTQQNTQKLFILATHQQTLDPKIQTLKKAGITVSAAEMNGYAQYRCLCYCHPDISESQSILMIHFEPHHLDMMLAKKIIIASNPLSLEGDFFEKILQSLEFLLASHPQEPPTRIIVMGHYPAELIRPLQERTSIPVHALTLSPWGLSPEWNTALGLALRNLI